MTARRLLALSPPERRVAVEAALCLAAAEVFVRLLPFRRLAFLLGKPGKGPEGRSVADAEPIRRALARAARHMPWRPTCLRQALAGALMLRRRGLPWVIHFGVARDETGLIAHAWLESGGSVLTGAAGRARFTPIAAFHGACAHEQ